MEENILKKGSNYNTILPSLLIYFFVGFIVIGWKFDYNIKSILFIVLLFLFILIGEIYVINQLYTLQIKKNGLVLKKILNGRIKRINPSEITFRLINGSVYLSVRKVGVSVLVNKKKVAELKFMNEQEFIVFYNNSLQNGYKWKKIPKGSRLSKII